VKALSVVSLQSIAYGEPIPDDWPDVAKQLMDDELRRLRGLEGVEGDITTVLIIIVLLTPLCRLTGWLASLSKR
jgi:hypothetical protein